MSSDKAPERYYKLKGHVELMPENLVESYDKIEASYVRDDLFGQPCPLRRREMFEKVALIKIRDGFGYAKNEVAQMVDWILADADKFARGEE